MLILLILIPIIGSLFILPMNETCPQNVSQMKKIALSSTILNFFISLFVWYKFDSNTTQYQFVSSLEITDTLQFCHLNFGIDGISLFFVLLTTFVSPIAILSNYNNILIAPVALSQLSLTREASVAVRNSLNFFNTKISISRGASEATREDASTQPRAVASDNGNNSNILEKANVKLFLVSFLLLESLQICAFVSLDLLLFYIFFESVLPILFIVIIIFGHGMDRFRSAFLLFLYTLAGSLPMLLSILMIYNYIGSTDFQLISLIEISLESQKLLWLGFFIAFAVKTPLYPFIIWLPKAHSDSPLAGSILLAATILKLATYGYLRVLIQILPDATHYFSPLIQSIAIISLIYASFSTIVQQDTKRLIAYSSVCHMAVVVLGLFSNTIQGIEGAILFGIAHGFVSPALFICVGGIIYDRTGTRIIKYIRGIATYMPVFTILFFIFTIANTGIPLTLNFLGEQLSLLGIWQQNPIIAALGATGIVLSAIYSLFLYNRLSYGNYSPYLRDKSYYTAFAETQVAQGTGVNNAKANIVKDINRREYFLLIALLIPTVILGLFPNVLLEALHLSVSSLLYIV